MAKKFHKQLKGKLASIDMKYHRRHTRSKKASNAILNNYCKKMSSKVRVYQLSEEEMEYYKKQKK